MNPRPDRLRSALTLLSGFFGLLAAPAQAANPIITHVHTADPAAIVHDGRVYLYAGQDEAPDNKSDYHLHKWLCFSSDDMVHWTPHGSPLAATDFKWAKGSAWASQVVEHQGKFYFFATVAHATKPGMSIGVAVSDSPTGPFVDARGSALVTNDMTTATRIRYDDIDPTVWIEDDGQAWLFWGNQKCYYAKLKANMIELDGEIRVVPDAQVPRYTEAPWIHKRGDTYYLSYASGFPETISYSTATSLAGPWTPRGLLAEGAFNSTTIHQGVITFRGRHWFFYHNGSMQHDSPLRAGGGNRRSACIEELFYNPDGTLRRVVQTTEGVSANPLR